MEGVLLPGDSFYQASGKFTFLSSSLMVDPLTWQYYLGSLRPANSPFSLSLSLMAGIH